MQGGRATPGVYQVESAGDQTAVSGKRRLLVAGGRRYNRRAMRDHQSAGYDDAADSRLAPKHDHGRFDF
jgi:hypothetical protein